MATHCLRVRMCHSCQARLMAGCSLQSAGASSVTSASLQRSSLKAGAPLQWRTVHIFGLQPLAHRPSRLHHL